MRRSTSTTTSSLLPQINLTLNIFIVVQVAQNRQNGRTVSGLRPESHPKGLDGSEGGKHRYLQKTFLPNLEFQPNSRYQNFPPPLSSMGTSTSLATDPGTLQPEDVYAGSSLYSSRVDLPHHSFSPSPRLEHRMSLQRWSLIQ